MHPARWPCLVLGALLVAGCGTAPWSKPAADPALRSGMPLRLSLSAPVLLSAQPVRLLRVAADADRTIHVLQLPPSGDRLRYSTLRDGRLVEADGPPAALRPGEAFDAMVDSQGALLTIVGSRLFERASSGWRELASPGCWRFIRGGRNVACLFELVAPDPRYQRRWDWMGFGGFGAGIVWPWPSQVSKFGIAERAGSNWAERGIVDRASPMSLAFADPVASQEGDIEIVYRRRRYLFAEDSQLRYERFNAPGHPAAPLPRERVGPRGADDTSWSLLGVSLHELANLAMQTTTDNFWGNPRIATTRDGRESVVLASDNSGGVWARRILDGIPEQARLLLDAKEILRVQGAVTLGDGRMLALIEESRTGWWSRPPQPLMLIEYRNGRWSLPADAGSTVRMGESSLLAVGADSIAVLDADEHGRPMLRLIRVLP